MNKNVMRSPSMSFRLVPLTATIVTSLLLPGYVGAANECGDPDANGASTDSFTCPSGTQSGGFTYSTNGDLELTLPAETNVGAAGIHIVGNGADSVGIDATGNIRSSNGVLEVLDISTGSGSIEIGSPNGITSTASTGTHGIRAISTGGGAIEIDVQSGRASGTDGFAGIEARSTGGNGDVSINLTTSLAGGGFGARYGILAQASGTGALTITGSGRTVGATGIAGIDATTDTGLLTINIIENNNPDGGAGIVTHTGGNAILNIGAQVKAGSTNSEAAIVLNPTAAGSTSTINVAEAGVINGLGSSTSSSNQNEIGRRAIVAQGLGNVVGHFNGAVGGSMDLSGLDGNATFNVNATDGRGWVTAGTSLFAQGNDTINIAASGGLYAGQYNLGFDSGDTSTSFDFLTGTNTINNEGVLIVGPSRFRNREIAATLELVNLDSFNNSGLITLGQNRNNTNFGTGVSPPADVPDEFADDVLAMQGAAFTGSGDSRIVFDVLLTGGLQGQDSCARIGGGNNRLPAADCVDLRNGTTAGHTLVEVHDTVPGDRGAFFPDGIVLIDVSGTGTSAAGHFSLSPDSSQYRDVFGGVVDKGLIFYPLIYDAENQQQKLYGVPNDSALQQPLIAHGAEQVWRTATAGWFDRQADQRDVDRAVGNGGGIWFRANSDSGDRSVGSEVPVAGETLVWNNSHQLDTWSATFGVDLVSSASADRAWVFGGMAGYAHGEMRYDASPNSVKMDGMSVGLYGSYLSGGLFVDTVINTTWMNLHQDIPGLNLFPAGTLVSTKLSSLGGRVEAGWRFGEGQATIEPLIGFAHVGTSFDDYEVPSRDPGRKALSLSYEDQTSTRASVGLRTTLSNRSEAVRVKLTLTGRYIREFDEEAEMSIVSAGPEGSPVAPVTGVFGPNFTDLTAGLTIANATGKIAALVNGNLKYGNDYDSFGLSAGFRYQW